MTVSPPQDRTGSSAPRRGPRSVSRSRRRKGLPAALTPLAIGLLLLAAAGCSTRSELGFMTLMSEVPATRASLMPPPGGPGIVAVLQRTFKNGLSQEIALSTAALSSGQNAFYVSMINDPTTQSEIDDTLKIPELTQELVQSEMEERFPGIDMQTSLLYAQNKYGPFGFATGKSLTGDLCLYAWQRIEPKESAVLITGGIISVRLRLCDADATAEQLLRTMYGYTVSAYFASQGWNPYGSPPPVPAHLGQIDAPIHPLGIGESLAPAVVRRQTTPLVTRPAARVLQTPSPVVDKDTLSVQAPAPAARAPAEELRSPGAGYPVVPPPPTR